MTPKEFQKSNLAFDLRKGKKRLEDALRGLSDEQCARAGATRSGSVADLLSEIAEPNCKACFDAWAVALQGGDLTQAVERMARWLVHTTVADYVRRPRFQYLPSLVNYVPGPEVVRAVPMGHGFIDYPAFFQALVQANYSGYVAYEMCSPLEGGGSEANLDRCAATFVTYMRKLLN